MTTITALPTAASTTGPASDRAKLHALQVLRGIAATFVVMYHANLLFGEGNWIPGSRLFSMFAFGHAGVDLFFVLSGFIILRAHWGDQSAKAAIRRYVLRRVIRIYPAVIVTVLVLLTLLPAMRATTGDQGLFSSDRTSVAASLLLVPLTCSYFPGVLWSLQDEIYFYVLFLAYYVHRRLFVVLIFLWAGFVVANGALSLAPRLAACGSSPLSLYNALFAAGAATYFAWRILGQASPAWLAPLCLAAGTAVFAVAAVNDVQHLSDTYWGAGGFDGVTRWKLLTRSGYGLAGMLLVTGAALSAWRPVTRLGYLFNLIGDASFAIYLVHLPVLGMVSRLLHSETDAGIPTSAAILGLMAISSLGAGIAFHLWVEMPLLRTLRRVAA